jgi:hypothetical protein
VVSQGPNTAKKTIFLEKKLTPIFQYDGNVIGLE